MQTNLRFPAKRFVSFLLMVIICVTSVATVVAATITATVIDDGKSITVQVLSAETDNILNQAKVKLGADDIVTRTETNGIIIDIKRAYNVRMDVDGKIYDEVAYRGDTVFDLLEDNNIDLGVNDTVSPAANEQLTKGTTVSVTRKVAVKINVDGKEKNMVVPVNTVGKVLIDQGIILGQHDIVNVGRNEIVSDGMSISVNRVSYREVTVTEPIPFETVTKKTDSLAKGTTKVETPGVEGSQTVSKREKLVDGKVVSAEVLKADVHAQPVSQVVIEGTKAKPSNHARIESDGTLIDQAGNVVNYSKFISGNCSAYTSNGGYTSTGKKAQVGYVAVDPDVIPYGTKMYICSPDGKLVYGYAIAADTGGAMLSGRILADLYYNSESECYNFGIRNMRVYILD